MLRTIYYKLIHFINVFNNYKGPLALKVAYKIANKKWHYNPISKK